jgi:hypothetical protein
MEFAVLIMSIVLIFLSPVIAGGSLLTERRSSMFGISM